MTPNYASYLPAGPNYSAGRSGTQYFQIELIRSNVSEFRISYTGSCAGSLFVCQIIQHGQLLVIRNKWLGRHVPSISWSRCSYIRRAGCSSGGLMDNNGGTFTCVFGTESSSNDSNNRILIRWKLTSGQSITAMSFTST